MPVRKVKGGFLWGSHGKTYKSKAGAERQARAAFANGYRGDGGGPRQAHARAVMAALRGPELRYVMALRGVVRGLHRAMAASVDAHLVAMAAHRSDAARTRSPLDMGMVETHFVKQVASKVGPLFDRMARTVDASNQAIQGTLYPVRLGDVGVAGAIAKAREANIRLVEDAGRAYAADVRAVMSDPDNFGRRVEDLRDELVSRGSVSESRAALIARDQTLKLNGAITQARQTGAGIDGYTWSTSSDERVRDTHAEKEGERFAWDSPPADTGHPGEDFQCRCVPVPFIAGIDDADVTPETNVEEPASTPALPLGDVQLPESPEAHAAAQGVLDDVAEHPIIHDVLEKLPIQKPVAFAERLSYMGENLAGYYAPDLGLHVGLTHAPENFNRSEAWGRIFDVAARAKTEREFREKVWVHEFGHHVHRGSRDALDRQTTSVRVNDTINAAFERRPAAPFTGYSDVSAAEYFAESFSASVYHPDEFKAWDPSGHKMVEDVLKLRRVRR